ncbi:MAG: hypothetical protein AAFQ63_02440 [Cyanobacteria bacterium J06621_11]
MLNPTAARRRFMRRRLIRRRSIRCRILIARYIGQGLVAFVAFVVAALLLNQIIPSPKVPSNVVFIGPKYDYYQAHKDDYDVLFFGSSRVYNHIVPDIFDASARTAGVAVNSYNFGIPAMRALDTTVLIDDVLSDPPENLKWVFVETILDKGYEPIPNARTHRSMYWHTWENTGLAARYILTSDQSWPSKTALLVSHLLPALYRQMNVGRLFSQVLPSEFSEREKEVAEEFTANEGYFPLTREDSPDRQAFLNDLQGYEALVDDLSETVAQPIASEVELARNKRMLLLKMERVIRAAGAEPIFIEPPSLEPSRDFQIALQNGNIDTLLAYKDPARFPQLYQPDQRYDADHLTKLAAREFSQLLAEDFVQTLEVQVSEAQKIEDQKTNDQ